MTSSDISNTRRSGQGCPQLSWPMSPQVDSIQTGTRAFPSHTDSEKKSLATPEAYVPVKSATVSSQETVLSNEEAPTRHSSHLQPKSRKFAFSWSVSLLTLASAAVAVWFSQRVMVDRSELPPPLRLTPGGVVLVVNILSQLVAYLAFSLFSEVTEQLRWSLACRKEGMPLTSFLVLSRATPLMGVFYLFTVRGTHLVWGMQRVLFRIITALLSLVLIANVTFKRVFTPDISQGSATFNVIAGLAPLSTAGLETINIELIPILAASYSIAFLTDPRFVTNVAPIRCSTSDPSCLSLVMPGGMELVRVDGGPRIAESLYTGNFTGDYDTIVVHDAPAYQIEYDSISSMDPGFTWNRTESKGDCQMFGADIGEGIYICLRETGDSIHLGWTICPDQSVSAGTCQVEKSWTSNVRWNTTVSLFSRLATVAYDRGNLSIISVERLSEPAPVKVNKTEALLYMNVAMAPIDPVLNYASDNATYAYSAARAAFSMGLSFLLRMYTSDYSTYQDGGVYLLRSFIAVPLQFATAMRQYGTVNLMPPENRVTATLSRSQYRAIIDDWTVWVFAWLAFPAILYCIGFLVWMACSKTCSPNISAFPEIDMASKSSAYLRSDVDPTFRVAGQTPEDLGRLTRRHGLGDGESTRIARATRGKRVYCGSLPDARGEEGEHVVLLTEEAETLDVLNRTKKYG